MSGGGPRGGRERACLDKIDEVILQRKRQSAPLRDSLRGRQVSRGMDKAWTFPGFRPGLAALRSISLSLLYGV